MGSDPQSYLQAMHDSEHSLCRAENTRLEQMNRAFREALADLCHNYTSATADRARKVLDSTPDHFPESAPDEMAAEIAELRERADTLADALDELCDEVWPHEMIEAGLVPEEGVSVKGDTDGAIVGRAIAALRTAGGAGRVTHMGSGQNDGAGECDTLVERLRKRHERDCNCRCDCGHCAGLLIPCDDFLALELLDQRSNEGRKSSIVEPIAVEYLSELRREFDRIQKSSADYQISRFSAHEFGGLLGLAESLQAENTRLLGRLVAATGLIQQALSLSHSTHSAFLPNIDTCPHCRPFWEWLEDKGGRER